MPGDSLIERQAALQQEAAAFLLDLGVERALSGMGRMLGVGSAFTGLMVWRDVDFVVDGGELTTEAAFDHMLPLLKRCRAVRYEYQLEPHRHYFVMHLPWREHEWKLDVSIFLGGMPAGVEAFQRELLERLDDPTRLLLLELKDAWYRLEPYPEIVGGYEIYDAVLHHGVGTLDDLDRYLAERGLPTRAAP